MWGVRRRVGVGVENQRQGAGGVGREGRAPEMPAAVQAIGDKGGDLQADRGVRGIYKRIKE